MERAFGHKGSFEEQKIVVAAPVIDVHLTENMIKFLFIFIYSASIASGFVYHYAIIMVKTLHLQWQTIFYSVLVTRAGCFEVNIICRYHCVSPNSLM